MLFTCSRIPYDADPCGPTRMPYTKQVMCHITAHAPAAWHNPCFLFRPVPPPSAGVPGQSTGRFAWRFVSHRWQGMRPGQE